MNRTLLCKLCLSLFVTIAAAAFSLTAQTDESEVVELSPFEVRAEDNDGYRATNSIAGTRIYTPLAELPINIEVVTETFLDDIAAFDLQEALSYQAGVVTSGDTGARIRGFNSLWNQRNGFRRYDYGDAVSIQRVEVIKGPAAVLYGITAPGGITNYITKRPLPSNFVELKQFYGTHEFYRTELDLNYGERDALQFRLLGSYTQNNSWLSNVERDVLYFNPVVGWHPTDDTRVIVEAEFLRRDRTPNVGRLWDGSRLASENADWFDNIHPTVDHGTAFVSTEDEVQSNDVDTYSVTVEHAFSDNFTARFNAYFIDRQDNETSTSRRGFMTNVSAVRDREGELVLDAAGNRIPGVRRHWARDSSQNEWQSYQLDLLYTMESDWGTHQFLGGAYYSYDNHYRILFEDRDFIPIDDPANPGEAPAGFRANPVGGNSNWPQLGWLGNDRKVRWVPIGASDPFLGIADPNYDPVSFVFPWLEYQDDIINYALYVNYLGTYLDDRLNVMAGLRYDKNDYERASFGAVGAQTPTENDKWSPQVGLIYEVIDDLSVYGLHSTSMNPANGRANSFEESLDPETGEQYELGLKGEFLDGRLSGTLGFFQVVEQDKIINDPDLVNAGGTMGDVTNAGEVESTGFDLNVYGNLVKGWSFVASASYVDQEVTEDTNPDRVGDKLDNFRGSGFNWTLWNNYTFLEGPAAGLSLGLGIIYTGEWDGRSGRAAGDLYTLDALARYTFMVADDYRVETALNIKNLTDEKDLGDGGGWISPREIFLSAAVRF